MRDPKRIKRILEQLERIWTKNPDFRFGQLIMSITKTGEHSPKLFNLEDDEFIKKIGELENLLKANENKF